jgi:hypothetical protein
LPMFTRAGFSPDLWGILTRPLGNSHQTLGGKQFLYKLPEGETAVCIGYGAQNAAIPSQTVLVSLVG